MNQSKIAVRYAKALFVSALEKNTLETVNADVELIAATSLEVPRFGLFMASPVVKPSQKLSFVTTVFKSSVSDLTMGFLKLLIENKRETELENVLRRFIYLYREYKGIKSATITTVDALNEQSKKKLMDLLSNIYKTNVELEIQNDPAILGGFILKVGDQQYDASIATGLKRMKNTLLSEINK